MDENKVCKISDFGLTRDIYEDNAYFKKSKGRGKVIFNQNANHLNRFVIFWYINKLTISSARKMDGTRIIG